MKRIALFLVVLFAAFESLSAQATMDLKINYDVNGRVIKEEVEPNYYPEAGIIRVRVRISSYGFVHEPTVDSTATTVWNKKQIESVIQAANDTRFESDYNAPDSLYGYISYITKKLTPEQLDSLKTEYLSELASQAEIATASSLKSYYKLYPTDNMWTFIELETTTGRLWQVQYSVDKDSEKYRFKTVLSLTDKRVDSHFPDAIIPGRFELYKTQNMYNFILLDTLEGNTWQVQWSTDWEKRGAIPIN